MEAVPTIRNPFFWARKHQTPHSPTGSSSFQHIYIYMHNKFWRALKYINAATAHMMDNKKWPVRMVRTSSHRDLKRNSHAYIGYSDVLQVSTGASQMLVHQQYARKKNTTSEICWSKCHMYASTALPDAASRHILTLSTFSCTFSATFVAAKTWRQAKLSASPAHARSERE